MIEQLLGVEAAQQRRGGVAGDDPAVVDDGDAVAELLRLLEIMRRQQHGDAAGVQLAHIAPELLAQLDIDARRGLVQHQDRRVMDQRLGHQQAPAHAPRQVRA